MMKIKRLILCVSILSFQNVFACPSKTRPSQNFDQYESIFLGQVVGVHLNEYQDMMVEGLRSDKDFDVWSDSTMEYTVTVLPQRLKKGEATEVETLKISGCGVPIPRMKMRGLFFVPLDGETRVLYQTDFYDYEDYLEKVGIYYLNQKQKLTIQRGVDKVNKE